MRLVKVYIIHEISLDDYPEEFNKLLEDLLNMDDIILEAYKTLKSFEFLVEWV